MQMDLWDGKKSAVVNYGKNSYCLLREIYDLGNYWLHKILPPRKLQWFVHFCFYCFAPSNVHTEACSCTQRNTHIQAKYREILFSNLTRSGWNGNCFYGVFCLSGITFCYKAHAA